MIEFLKHPWAWYIAGPLIGLMVPALLILGNRTLGISSSLRHVCAACMPAKIPYFNYDWKKEVWNLVFVEGIILGGLLVAVYLTNPNPVNINPKLVAELNRYGITEQHSLLPMQIFNWQQLPAKKFNKGQIYGGLIFGFG